MKAIKLKNGAEEADVLAAATMMILQDLMDKQPIAFYELVMKCRDRTHKLFGNAESVLCDHELMAEGGHIHDSIRNIVLSAAVGDGLDMHLVSPLAKKDQQ